jgi:hypothetical protein
MHGVRAWVCVCVCMCVCELTLTAPLTGLFPLTAPMSGIIESSQLTGSVPLIGLFQLTAPIKLHLLYGWNAQNPEGGSSSGRL